MTGRFRISCTGRWAPACWPMRLDIDDQELLHAVSAHTLGCLDMDDLDKIIYLADMIEAGKGLPGYGRARCLTLRNLDTACS